MAELIVGGTVAFAVALALAWLLRPDLRAWLEEPKHRLQADLLRYDRQRAGATRVGGEHRHD
jgi:hypothetical protein